MAGMLESPGKARTLANGLLLAGMAILIVGVLGAYCFDEAIGLGLVVGAHMLTILGPSLVKLGYVMRLSAQGRPLAC
ncbi:hypothetical protein [Geopseudomonas guangdongensis]|uniref:Transmembrane sensor/regulator PpyR n=1 Tax=Geopseudomonas guangdongensis TaxID=1245526 RepID=A0A1H2I0W4_9GAMM|nr:hypothetical protein [Pseudomonas guangdongensis]SDU37777.1 hypothetical protein SAMN05216580_2646 [Pseudomonas guangdongensis]